MFLVLFLVHYIQIKEQNKNWIMRRKECVCEKTGRGRVGGLSVKPSRLGLSKNHNLLQTNIASRQVTAALFDAARESSS